MGNTCQNLATNNDACQISICLENVTGLKSNSASPTDVWILTFINGTRYNNNPVNRAIMKYGVNLLVNTIYENI